MRSLPSSPPGRARPRHAATSVHVPASSTASAGTAAGVRTVRAPAGRGRAGAGGVDGWLTLAALCSSVLALLVLAASPAVQGPAGDAVRAVVVLLFWLVGPGAVIAVRLPLAPLVKVAQTPLVGIAVLVVVATVGSWTGVWIPRLSTTLAAVATAGAAAVTLRDSGLRVRVPRVRRPSAATVVPGLALLACLVTWVTSIPAVRTAPPSVFGLLVTGPWQLPVSILGGAVVFLVALRRRLPVVAAATGVFFVLVLRTTASVAAEVPIAAWTHKHLGVVGALQRFHEVNHSTDIYMNWPGMFAASAYVSDTTGVAVMDMARWFPPLVHVLVALQTATLARLLGARATGSVAAAVLVVLLNWIGQDYFSPQAVALCLAAGFLVLLVASSTSRAAAVLALGLFAAIMMTHQLTPFWLLGLTAALAIIRRVPWWLAAGMVLVVVAYLLPRTDVAETYGLFSGFDPVANAAGNVAPVPAPGREVGGLFAKGTAGLMWISTLAVLAVRAWRLGFRGAWRSDRLVLSAALAFAPVLLLGAQSYGGEALLRVTLYSTIGCAAVLGPALAGAMQGRLPAALAAAGWALLVVAGAAQCTYNQWWINLMRPEDVAAARWLAEEQADAAVIPVAMTWPGRASVDYDRFIGPRTREEQPLTDVIANLTSVDAGTTRQSFPLTPALVEEAARQQPGRSVYVVFTSAMRQYDAYYQRFRPGDYQATIDALAVSPDWELVRHEGDLWVFGSRFPAG